MYKRQEHTHNDKAHKGRDHIHKTGDDRADDAHDHQRAHAPQPVSYTHLDVDKRQDMCIGPHLTYTKALKAFKITQQSGAYWKNDKENKLSLIHI